MGWNVTLTGLQVQHKQYYLGRRVDDVSADEQSWALLQIQEFVNKHAEGADVPLELTYDAQHPESLELLVGSVPFGLTSVLRQAVAVVFPQARCRHARGAGA